MEKEQKRGERSLYAVFLPIVFVVFALSITHINPIKGIITEDVSPGDYMLTRVQVRNDLGGEIKDLRISVVGLDIDVYGLRANFELRGKESTVKAVLLDVPRETKPGKYWLKFTMSNERFKQSEFREITII
tara:strand:+ start:3104 stop:3496 length:393 start_codon:yes stop_codon:yes gene_type:complete